MIIEEQREIQLLGSFPRSSWHAEKKEEEERKEVEGAQEKKRGARTHTHTRHTRPAQLSSAQLGLCFVRDEPFAQ